MLYLALYGKEFLLLRASAAACLDRRPILSSSIQPTPEVDCAAVRLSSRQGIVPRQLPLTFVGFVPTSHYTAPSLKDYRTVTFN